MIEKEGGWWDEALQILCTSRGSSRPRNSNLDILECVFLFPRYLRKVDWKIDTGIPREMS